MDEKECPICHHQMTKETREEGFGPGEPTEQWSCTCGYHSASYDSQDER